MLEQSRSTCSIATYGDQFMCTVVDIFDGQHKNWDAKIFNDEYASALIVGSGVFILLW